MVNNDSVTIMQKVEELKQWQRQHEARQLNTEAFVSPKSSRDEGRSSRHELVNFSSPSMQLKPPENLTVRSEVVDLDNGIHIIDELLNRIQNQSAKDPPPPSRIYHTSSPQPQEEEAHPERYSLEREQDSHSLDNTEYPELQYTEKHPLVHTEDNHSVPADSEQSGNSQPKPKKQFLKRGEGLSRFRMTLNDFKKPTPKPSFVMGKNKHTKRVTRPVAVPAPESTRPPVHHQRPHTNPPTSSAPSRPNLLSKAALQHLATWSNVFGSTGSNEHELTNDESTNTRFTYPRSENPLQSRVPEMSPLTQHRTHLATAINGRKKKESDEQTMFDLLEQKARDESSFTSCTSSMVATLMQESGDRSTPVKTNSGNTVQNKSTSHLPEIRSHKTAVTSDRLGDKSSQVRFSETNSYRNIADSDQSCGQPGFTIEALSNHTHATNKDSVEECECSSECDTQYCSSEEGESDVIPSLSVNEALGHYKAVLNRPYVSDSGKSGSLSYSQLAEYLKLAKPTGTESIQSFSCNNSTGTGTGPVSNNNPVVKETKQLLETLRRIQEEKERLEENEEHGLNKDSENKENNRNKANNRGRQRGEHRLKNNGNSFPRTVYQETYQNKYNKKKQGPTSTPGSSSSEPNPFLGEPDASLELLRKRLTDLENEIHIFRLENIKLNKARTELDKDKAAFTRERKQKEKELVEEKETFTRSLEEERNKLNREKKVFLKYAKDAKNFPAKAEREELIQLKAELNRLKEDHVKKESKFAAAQARLRNTVKTLEDQNAELKVQVEKLGKEAKKVSFASKKHISNTQIMNAINSQLSKLNKSDVLSNPHRPNAKPPTSILKKTRPPSPATDRVDDIIPRTDHRSSTSSYNLKLTPDEPTHPEMPEDSFDRAIYQSLYNEENKPRETREFGNNPVLDSDVIPIETLHLGTSPKDKDQGVLIPDKDSDKDTDPDGYKEIITGDGTKERHYKDGRQEIHYQNGNTVIISEAGQYVKMFYYNGDIKETDTSDGGTVRYFYSETNTWHTTLPDGTEMLEFSNGQKEKRYQDGRVEVEYSNGATRTINKQGTEVWRFDSGPVASVEILSNEERILHLRNGQREIHTRDFKRREFPDGAVKLVYPDGIVETRYPNGRIRLKDANGGLIMDSHQMGE
uniref:Centromere protein J n=1 Tax=Cacopsylla melanoneura TaxID=428564 RepID=A0A8D8Y3C8_9HEMI